jgi:hypothetical protein
MTTAVTSKFTTLFWVKMIVIIAAILIAVIFGAVYLSLHHTMYPTSQIIIFIVLAVAAVGVYTYNLTVSLLKITAAHEGLILYYMLTKKKIVIDYADILHVSNVHSRQTGLPTSSGGVKLVIELSTGEEFFIKEENYENYVELKDALREFRFHLDNPDHE